MMRKNWKKEQSIIEIAILIISSFAFSFIVYESSGLIDRVNKISEESVKIRNDYRLGKITLDVAKKLLDKLKEPMIPVVSAEELSFKCCEKTVNNSICQDVVLASDCQTGKQLAPTACAQTSFCKPGCCIDDEEGTFDKNVPQAKCQGRWVDDKNCNLPEARFGCCILGSTTQFLTQRQCEKATTDRAQGNGTRTTDWRQVDEAVCTALSYVQEEGACLIGGRACKFGTKRECVSLTGSANRFFPNTLCTAPELNTTCQKTEETKCFTGKDEVYFIDSCGNKANIYDASRANNISYWTGVVAKNQSCGATSANNNANSATCGNCFRFGQGSICAPKNVSTINPQLGKYFCKETSCKYKNETYKNGESWCVYDGTIGNGDDVVGSRHWKYVCNQGEIQVEPCADYRNQICIQQNTAEVNGTGVAFKNANCVANNWRECIDLNSQKGNISECDKKLNCRIEKVNIADKFHFNICTPKYPGGFHLTSEGERDVAKQICGMATQTCTVVYKQTLLGSCEVVANEDCLKPEFTQKMNDFCRKLGDCGGEVNIDGKFTKNYKVKEAPALSKTWISKLVALSKPVSGQYAEVENYTEYLQAAGILGPTKQNPGSGGGGGGNLVGAGAGIAGVGGLMVAMGYIGAFQAFVGPLAAFGGAFIAVGVGMIAGQMIGKMLGLSGLGSLLMGAGIAILIMGLAAAGVFGTQLAFLGVLCAANPIACIAVAIIIIITSLFFGGSKCPPVKVKYTCEPWQPPAGGGDCEKCNGNSLKPCSEYRCNSLGAACKLINKGTTEEMCYNENPNDATPPIATPDPSSGGLTNTTIESTSTGFRITNMNGGCVNAYTNLVWGVNTNEPATCKFDTQTRDNWEDFEFDLGSNAYGYNHTTAFSLPDPSHGQSQGYNITGDFIFYIKCQDTHGNMIPGFYTAEMCVNEGPDRTAPLIRAANPENNKLVSFNSIEKNVSIYTNEPSDCKWSKENKEYPNMENLMECQNGIEDMGIYGYQCDATLPIENSTNIFYVRCKDQPWLEGNETPDKTRNANSESYVYTLNKPASMINITGVAPNTDFDIFNSPTTGKIRATTSGGGLYHKCSYRVAGYSLITFQNTYSTLHEQEIPWYSGLYDIYVECEDETGDKASTTTSFEVSQDLNVPVVARIYRDGNSIKIVTSEDADCRYSTNRNAECQFAFSNASSMGSGKIHTISSSVGQNYFIKCKDNFGNIPDGCSVVVTPTI